MGFVNINRQKFISALEVFVNQHQRAPQFGFGCGNLVTSLCQIGKHVLHMLPAFHYNLTVKSVRCCGKICRVKLNRVVNLVPHQSDSIDYIGGGMSLREHVADFLKGVDIPLGNAACVHGILHIRGNDHAFFILADKFHDLEGQRLVHAVFMNERHHNVVTASDNVGNRTGSRRNQLVRISEPAACSVSKSGNLQKVREILRLCAHENAADERSTHFGESQR